MGESPGGWGCKKRAARERGLRYSQLMHGLKKAGVEVNRKELAIVAYRDGEAFDRFVEMAKAAL